MLEDMRPKIQQYFIESDTDGTPINRNERSVIYQRAKKQIDTIPFGTQMNVYANWYRNWSRNWAAFEGVDQTIRMPALFIAASDELVVGPEHVEAMRPLVPDLTVHTLEPCGHWSQQERPEDVNRLIVEWLMQRG